MTSGPEIALIWAQDASGVIGVDGVMPWHVPEDLAHFKELTLGAPVVMGRRTWDSLPERFRPLEGRFNIVVTRQKGWAAAGATGVGSIEHSLSLAERHLGDGNTIWVIGGAQIFEAVMPLAERLEVTELASEFAGDTSAPQLESEWRVDSSEPPQGYFSSRSGIDYRFVRYSRRVSGG